MPVRKAIPSSFAEACRKFGEEMEHWIQGCYRVLLWLYWVLECFGRGPIEFAWDFRRVR